MRESCLCGESGHTAGIVLAHGKAHATIARHWQNWTCAFYEIIVVCPVDDQLSNSITCGESSHHGRGTIDRLKLAMAIAGRYPQAAILEYDTLVWNPPSLLPGDTLLCSRVFQNHDPQFSASDYGHSPWMATKETWWRLLNASMREEHGWPDRMLSAAARLAGVKLSALPQSYSCDQHWGESTIQEAEAAARLGACAIHGFKDEAIFSRLIQCHPSSHLPTTYPTGPE